MNRIGSLSVFMYLSRQETSQKPNW